MNKLLNNNLVVRTLSGAVLALVVVGSILASPYLMMALMAVICIGAMLEFYKLAALSGAKPQESLPTFVGALIIVLAFFTKLQELSAWTFVAVIPLLWLIFIIELYRKSEQPFTNIAWSMLGVIYIALPLALLVYLPIQPATHGYIVYRPWMVLSVILIVWANDIGAYLVGCTLGRHRLFERISPKKSWEGFIGGVLCATAAGVALSSMQSAPWWVWGGAAVIIALSGVFGDLIESMLKRSLQIKDSGNAIPGHGGFLDRFDALLLAAPMLFVYLVVVL